MKKYLTLFLVALIFLTGCEVTSTRTVTFDSDGGSIVESQEVKYNDKIEVPAPPTKAGYDFFGWFYNDVEFDFDTKITEDITIYAKWEKSVVIEKVTVTFKDGEQTIKEEEITSSSTVTKPDDLAKDGYTFLGWFYNDAEFDFDTKITEDIIIYAKWEKNVVTYTVTFVNWNNEVLKTQQVNENEDATPPNPPIRDGYTFFGWDKSYTEVKSSLTIKAVFTEDANKISIVLVYNEGYASFDDLYTDFLKDYSVSAGKTITKNLTEEGVSEFCSNSYNGGFNKFYKEYSSKYEWLINAIIAHRTKSQLSAVSWENDAFMTGSDSAEGIMRFELDSFFRKTVHTTWPVSSSYTESDQNEIVALKSAETETLSVDPSTYVLPLKEVDNMKIVGWYRDSALTNQVTSILESDNNKTFYAKWEKTGLSPSEITAALENTENELMKQLSLKVVTSNITLPLSNDTYNTTISWSSSNVNSISNTGVVTRTSTDVLVVLTATIQISNQTKEVKISITVGKIGMKDISSGGIVASYVYNGTYNRYPVNDTLLEVADIIYASFVLPESDGTITLSTSYKTCLNDYLDKAHKAGVRVIMCIGQEGATYCKNFSLIARDDALRSKFVNNIITLINEYGFDGVDIDWEYPGYQTGLETAVDKLNYTLLIKDIYTAVKKNNSSHLVTSAIPAGPWGYVRFDLANSTKYLDYVNLMSYDLQCSEKGQKTYHHTALYKSDYTYNKCSVDESVDLFVSQGVDISKIIIGAGFYGRYSTVTSSGASSSGIGAIIGEVNGSTKVGATITYSNIYTQYLQNPTSTAVRYWDDVAKAPYIYDSVNQIFVTYDDSESIGYKCDYVKTKKVAGIMYWDNGSDNTGTLINAIKNKLDVLKGN